MAPNNELNLSELQKDMLLQAYELKPSPDASAGEREVLRSERSRLIGKMGYDWYDIEDIFPNPENVYTITDDDVEGLAELIRKTGITTPLVLRAMPEGYEIVDGERRWRAHKLLTERYGDQFRMVLAKCFDAGELSDEDMRFILHAENIGQRAMDPSERAIGFAVIAEKLKAEREAAGTLRKTGERLVEEIARQYGISPSTVKNELAIGQDLVEEGLAALDAKVLKKTTAVALSRLPEEVQREIIAQAEQKGLSNAEIAELVKAAQASKAKARTSPTSRPKRDQMTIAADALKKMLKRGEVPSPEAIQELEDLLDIAKRQAKENSQ